VPFAIFHRFGNSRHVILMTMN